MDTSIEMPSGLSWRHAAIKRTFDVIASFAGLLVTWPLVLFAWLLATWDTGMNGFFVQPRVGRFGKCFMVIKIRTMRPDSSIDTTVTTSEDPRITKIGRLLRIAKIDELPQLINVLLGSMSFVGPRPDVPGFADKLEGGDRVVLSVRPGITGPATLKYRDEEEVLKRQTDPDRYNRDVIFPDKVRINREYIENYRFLNDMVLIWKTIVPKKPELDERPD